MKWIFVILVVLFLVSPPWVYSFRALPLDTRGELFAYHKISSIPLPKAKNVANSEFEGKNGVLVAIPNLLETHEKGQNERFLKTSISTVNTFCEKFEGYKEYRECVDDLLEEFLL